MQLCIDNVSKQYSGKNWALRDFTLQMGPGVLGLLGPNGAGKTTLISILATITRATAGRIQWNETDLAQKSRLLAFNPGIFAARFWRVSESQRG